MSYDRAAERSSCLPSGVVTFLMSDVEGSGRHWSANASATRKAVAALDRTVDTAVEQHSGFVLKPRGEGDSHFAVFDSPSEALLAAVTLHSRLDRTSATGPIDLRVRVGVHLGEAQAAGYDYYGLAVNQTARLRSVAHGGQTVLSRAAAAIAEPSLATGVRLRSLGYHRLRDFPRLEEVFQATAVGTRDSFPPLRTGATRSPAVLALVFVDICGASAAARAGRGPVDVIAVQREWTALLREVSARHSCATLKLLGDGCMAAFEDPLDARAFVAAIAVAVARTGLQVRAGIDAGRVEVIDGEVVGEAVIAASELCRHADAGKVLTTPALRDLLGAAATARPVGPYTLPAVGRTIQLFEL